MVWNWWYAEADMACKTKGKAPGRQAPGQEGQRSRCRRLGGDGPPGSLTRGGVPETSGGGLAPRGGRAKLPLSHFRAKWAGAAYTATPGRIYRGQHASPRRGRDLWHRNCAESSAQTPTRPSPSRAPQDARTVAQQAVLDGAGNDRGDDSPLARDACVVQGRSVTVLVEPHSGSVRRIKKTICPPRERFIQPMDLAAARLLHSRRRFRPNSAKRSRSFWRSIGLVSSYPSPRPGAVPACQRWHARCVRRMKVARRPAARARVPRVAARPSTSGISTSIRTRW